MTGWPSLWRCADLQRLLLAIAAPWFLLGLAYALPLLEGELHRAGYNTDWLYPIQFVWFYGFGFTAGAILIWYFCLGIYRLLAHQEYRFSLYGWISAVLFWLNMCGLTALVE